MRLRPAAVLVALAALVAGVVVLRLLAGPGFVDRISFENPTVYDLHVEVRGGGGDGWLALATSVRQDTAVVEDVVDVGAVWVFRFSAQGTAAGELRVTREELERDGWRVIVPDRVGERLRELAVPAP